MPLAFSFVVLAVGVIMITAGVADPDGGPLGMLRDLTQGKAPQMRGSARAKGSVGGVLEYMPALLATGGAGGGGGVQTASAAGGGIVGAARAQLGKPYQWGGAGPDRWDCSGLVWHAVKVGAPMAWGRTTAEGQRTSKLGATIPATAALPGDIIFFGVPAYHCGIYTGGGQMIHAPSAGDVVKESPTGGRTGPITYRRFPAPVVTV